MKYSTVRVCYVLLAARTCEDSLRLTQSVQESPPSPGSDCILGPGFEDEMSRLPYACLPLIPAAVPGAPVAGGTFR